MNDISLLEKSLYELSRKLELASATIKSDLESIGNRLSELEKQQSSNNTVDEK